MDKEILSDFPLVSIIIPLYNHEKYIKAALNSVLEETYPNKEIIIINDGSSDNSEQEFLKWKEINAPKFNVIYQNQNNKGVCKTLNQLITISKGKYIVLLASDDLLYNNTIQQRVFILEKLEKNGKYVLVSDALGIDDKENIIYQSTMTQYNKGNKLNYFNDYKIMNEIITNPSISGPVVIINRKIYEIIGLYKENLMAEDWYFYQRVAACKALVFEDIICSKYRIHSLNTSGINSLKSKKVAFTCFLTYQYNWNLFPKIKYKFLALNQMSIWFLRYLKYSINNYVSKN